MGIPFNVICAHSILCLAKTPYGTIQRMYIRWFASETYVWMVKNQGWKSQQIQTDYGGQLGNTKHKNLLPVIERDGVSAFQTLKELLRRGYYTTP